MAARAIWAGHVKIGPTAVPVKLYSVAQDKSIHFHILDAKTGTEIYLRRLHTDRYCASPILAAGRVYVLARDGTMSVVKSGRHFELLAANTLDDHFTASPAVSNGRLYLRGFRSLYAIGEESKER